MYVFRVIKKVKWERTQQSQANMSSPVATSSAVSPRQRWLCSPSLWSPTWRERLYEKLQQSGVLQAPAKYFSGRSITTVTCGVIVCYVGHTLLYRCVWTPRSQGKSTCSVAHVWPVCVLWVTLHLEWSHQLGQVSSGSWHDEVIHHYLCRSCTGKDIDKLR